MSVEYFDQLLSAVLLIHFISNHDTVKNRIEILVSPRLFKILNQSLRLFRKSSKEYLFWKLSVLEWISMSKMQKYVGSDNRRYSMALRQPEKDLSQRPSAAKLQLPTFQCQCLNRQWGRSNIVIQTFVANFNRWYAYVRHVQSLASDLQRGIADKYARLYAPEICWHQIGDGCW